MSPFQGVVGGYTLHLYCCCKSCSEDKLPSTAREFGEPTARLAFESARRAGWSFANNHTKCFAKGHKPK